MTLTEKITALSNLDYDALRDVRDTLDWHRYERHRKVFARQMVQATTKRDLQFARRQEKTQRVARNRVALRRRGLSKGLDALLNDPPAPVADINVISDEELAPLRAAVVGLLDAKRPRAAIRSRSDGTPLARGSWQVKTRELLARDPLTGLPVPATDPDGNPVFDEDGVRVYEKYIGRYLYLRIYTITPDGKQRSASVYIGSLNKQDPDIFVQRVQSGIDLENNATPDHPDPITREQIVEAFYAGGYDAIKEWRDSVNE